MAECGNAKLFKVLGGEAREDPLVDLIVAECPLVFFEAQAPQPDHNVHDGAPELRVAASWSRSKRVSSRALAARGTAPRFFGCALSVQTAIAKPVIAEGGAGVSNATIKRDLVALSSVMSFAIDQGWCDSNPVLPRMRRLKERRDPIVLPVRAHIDLVISRCPGVVAEMVKVAMATGARQGELL